MKNGTLRFSVSALAALSAAILSLPAFSATYLFRIPVNGVPLPPALAHAPVTQTFAFDPNNFVTEPNYIEHTEYTASVPSWAEKAEVEIYGAGGSADYCGNGGSGAFLDVIVYAPFGGTSAAITVGKGGLALYSQGGGYTSALIGNRLVVAGSGGGGAPASTCVAPLNGGDGALPSGQPGQGSQNTAIGKPGLGGTQSGPGAGGSGASCTASVGNPGSGHYGGPVPYGGGGGDGYYGGGGGVPYNPGCSEGGAGGGGSSYIPNGASVVSVGSANNGSTPSSAGGNGSVTITWEP